MDVKKENDKVMLTINRSEAIAISQALNEICNNSDIDEAEFPTRLGSSLNEVRTLLKEMKAAF